MQVKCSSGAEVEATVYKWGLNLKITVPGDDRENTEGVCGNNNGILTDDYDGVVTSTYKYEFSVSSGAEEAWGLVQKGLTLRELSFFRGSGEKGASISAKFLFQNTRPSIPLYFYTKMVGIRVVKGAIFLGYGHYKERQRVNVANIFYLINTSINIYNWRCNANMERLSLYEK